MKLIDIITSIIICTGFICIIIFLLTDALKIEEEFEQLRLERFLASDFRG